MRRYDIKPDYHLKAKRRYLTALSVGLLLAFQAVSVLGDYSFNESWRNAFAIAGGLGGLLISGIGYWRYRLLIRNNKQKTY